MRALGSNEMLKIQERKWSDAFMSQKKTAEELATQKLNSGMR